MPAAVLCPPASPRHAHTCMNRRAGTPRLCSCAVDFAGALAHVGHLVATNASATGAEEADCVTIETGAHPALTPLAATELAAARVRVIHGASSMRRGQPEGFWRAEVAQLRAAMAAAATPSPDVFRGAVGAPGAGAHALSDIEESILAAVQAALTSSGLGRLSLDTPATREHALGRGFLELGLNSHGATRAYTELNTRTTDPRPPHTLATRRHHALAMPSLPAFACTHAGTQRAHAQTTHESRARRCHHRAQPPDGASGLCGRWRRPTAARAFDVPGARHSRATRTASAREERRCTALANCRPGAARGGWRIAQQHVYVCDGRGQLRGAASGRGARACRRGARRRVLGRSRGQARTAPLVAARRRA